MQLTDILVLLACAVSVIGGFSFGYKKGFFRGAVVGRDVEFYAMGMALTKLKSQDKYANILKDTQAEYEKIMSSALKDLQG